MVTMNGDSKEASPNSNTTPIDVTPKKDKPTVRWFYDNDNDNSVPLSVDEDGCNATLRASSTADHDAQPPIDRRSSHTRIDSQGFRESGCESDRLVVVRYFLDRPNYDLNNSAARFWFNPPSTVRPSDLHKFLKDQNIAMDGLLVEAYLDRFGSFMMLEACDANLVEWDFSSATYRDPGVINIRLTDLHQAEHETNVAAGHGAVPLPHNGPTHANTIPAGLFSFSMMVGLETAALMIDLFPGTVDPSFVLTWGPYMYFVGGLLQIIVGCFQVVRNNIYGATAFLVFGSFGLSFGTKTLLETYFTTPETVADSLLGRPDPVGAFIRNLFVFLFSCALLKQTFVMNKLNSTLIGLLCLKILCAALVGFVEWMKWGELIFGWLTSGFAFFVFFVEFTNDVYHRDLWPIFKWSEQHSPSEAFGTAGRQGTLHSRAAQLRRASYPTVRKVREASQDGGVDHLKQS